MTIRPPDHDPPGRLPLDAEEQAVARVLRALPSAEPPAALDARILRAAADAVAAGPRPRRLAWLGTAGAGWGIGSAAAAVLALGIGWQAYYGDARHREPLPVPVSRTVEADDADAPVMVDFKDHGTLAEQAAASPPAPPPAEAPAASPRPPLPARARAAAAAGPAPAVVPPPEAFPDAGLEQHVADAAAAQATAEAAAAEAGAAVARRAEARPEQSAKAAAGNAVGGAAAPAVALQAGTERGGAVTEDAAAASPARDQALVPATWLDEVRRLRDEGRTTDARARLLAFRRAYPHWNIPSDLAPLLRE